MDQAPPRPIVAKAYENDVGGVIARIDPDILFELGIQTGDVGIIRAEQESPVKLWKPASEHYNSGKIYLDDFSRHNAGAAIGTEVTVEAVEPVAAEKISISSYQGAQLSGDLIRSGLITNQWFNRPVSVGDVLPVMIDHDDIDCLLLVIDNTKPDGVVTVKRDTIITF